MAKKLPPPQLPPTARVAPLGVVSPGSRIISEKALRVLDLVAKEYNIYRISKILNLDKGTIAGKKGHLKRFEKKGLVKKIDHVWSITKLGLKVLKEVKYTTPTASRVNLPPPFTTPKKDVRGHGFRIGLELPREFSDWKKDCKKAKIKPKLMPQGHYSIKLNGFTIWLCKNSIYTIFPEHFSYFNELAAEGKYKALAIYNDLIQELEDRLGYNSTAFKIGGRYKLKISKQHYGHVKNAIAEIYNKAGLKLEINDKKNIIWFIGDKSLSEWGLIEGEAVNAATAVSDMDRVIKPLDKDRATSAFLNNYRDNPDTPMPSILNAMYERQQKLIDRQLELATEAAEDRRESWRHIKEQGAALSLLLKTVTKQEPKVDREPKKKEPGAYFG